MSMESANEFLVKVAQTDDLRARCDALASEDLTATAAAIANFGKTNGYDFTADEALSVMSGEMDSRSLDNVSGGVGKMGGKTSAVYMGPPYTPPANHYKHR